MCVELAYQTRSFSSDAVESTAATPFVGQSNNQDPDGGVRGRTRDEVEQRDDVEHKQQLVVGGISSCRIVTHAKRAGKGKSSGGRFWVEVDERMGLYVVGKKLASTSQLKVGAEQDWGACRSVVSELGELVPRYVHTSRHACTHIDCDGWMEY